MIRRLRFKFICVNMAIVTAMLLVIFGTVLHYTQESLYRQTVQNMIMAADDRQDAPPGPPGEVAQPVRQPHFIITVRNDGTVVTESSPFFDLSDPDTVQELLDIAMTGEEPGGVIDRYNLRYALVRTPHGDKYVFMDISGEQATLQSLIRICFLIGIASMTVFLGISILLARWAVRPVETAWNQQKQFVSDASHELKTPLSVIMTSAELLQEPGYDETQRRQFGQNILSGARQMRRLVENLLELARADNGFPAMALSALGLSRLTEDTLLLFEPLYFERGLSLDSQIQPELTVLGSHSHLQQVLEILLDNGLKYSSPEGTVRVTLEKHICRCQLCVESPGEPITKADLQNIFKRFYRIDPSRSDGCSYGLGLSIAESIVRKHQGKIWAESEDGINRFFVQLPMHN